MKESKAYESAVKRWKNRKPGEAWSEDETAAVTDKAVQLGLFERNDSGGIRATTLGQIMWHLLEQYRTTAYGSKTGENDVEIIEYNDAPAELQALVKDVLRDLPGLLQVLPKDNKKDGEPTSH